MAASYGAGSYASTEIQSAQPLQLVVLLYDGAVRAAATAHEAMLKKDIPARRAAVNKLMGIIAELQNSLDLERGGSVAAQLEGIYTYIVSRLIEGLSKQEPAPMAEVKQILETLRDAWRQIADRPVADGAGPGGRP